MKTQRCEHCNNKMKKNDTCVVIIPSNLEVKLGLAKMEIICMDCAVKEGRKVT